ncbi:hypothetical protein C8R44DRAFT_871532 [Mycena epipterygia]|nr:hypothetical protein C8R44DRAFT_871532 [Mycena epipterygia]
MRVNAQFEISHPTRQAMIFYKLFVTASLMSASLGAPLNITEPKPLAIPFGGGSASINQMANGGTRIYHQVENGSIWEIAATGPFLGKPTFHAQGLLVPANEVLYGTPIASTSVDGNFEDDHVFFFSPELIVSEYIWTGTEWIGGPSCTQCLTAQGFVAASAQYLYAAENLSAGAPSTLRVGFSSAGAPGSLTEANKVGGVWQLGYDPQTEVVKCFSVKSICPSPAKLTHMSISVGHALSASLAGHLYTPHVDTLDLMISMDTNVYHVIISEIDATVTHLTLNTGCKNVDTLCSLLGKLLNVTQLDLRHNIGKVIALVADATRFAIP